jgi:hypothetical protein
VRPALQEHIQNDIQVEEEASSHLYLSRRWRR